MPLTPNEIRNRAYMFVQRWKDDTSERGEAQSFWNELLQVFGVDRKKVASFEKSVERLGKNPGRIDLFWPGTLLAEHKSANEDIEKATIQAFEYLPKLKDRELPRYIIVSDFRRFKLFNLEEQEIAEVEFTLEQLPENIEQLNFLAGYTSRTYKDEDSINIEAAKKLGDLYDALKINGYEEHSLKVFLVRLLFILFAEDTGIFDKDHFRWCIENRTLIDGSDTGSFIINLFAVLDTDIKDRQKNLDDDLNKFRYINGSLFEENLRPPSFDADARSLLLDLCGIRWNEVSPAIFGSLFQSAMNKKERRRLGAHYTSEKNILKVISGLFLDELKGELDKLLQDRSNRKKGNLEAFQQKLRSLKFLDPACGCGNFLVIAYRELRFLEIAVIKELEKIEMQATGGQLRADTALRSMVDVDQFYGIEIEELPVQIARVALWLTDHQMNVQLAQETGLFHLRLPLKTEPHIVGGTPETGNALRLNWDQVVPREELSYILGNPPFIGKNKRTAKQTADMEYIFKKYKGAKNLDYVACWYVKAAEYIYETNIKVGLVSTNSITQGEQIGILWPLLFSQGVHIHFAHRTFKWKNEARGKAAVFCVIIGFALYPAQKRRLFEYDDVAGEPLEIAASNINPYLVDFENMVISNRMKPISKVPEMNFGNMPIDGGHFMFTEEEKRAFISQCPKAEQWFRPIVGSDELINGIPRFCLWLHDVQPHEYRNLAPVIERINAVKKARLESTDEGTQKLANRPYEFRDTKISNENYIAVPSTSSETRFYLPIAILPPEVIVSNLCLSIFTSSLYYYGILQSHMHMAWMRQVCGRLEGRYRYSKKIVYNNFPWPESPSKSLMDRVEQCAQLVLDTRQSYLDRGNTLADLYDPKTMRIDLFKAHQALDKAVDACYGRKSFNSELERVTFLFELYKGLIQGNQQNLILAEKPTRRIRSRQATKV